MLTSSAVLVAAAMAGAVLVPNLFAVAPVTSEK